MMSIQIAAVKPEPAFENARRMNQALTARIEKRALQWMAGRAPRWVSSDQLTVLGLGAQIGAGICYALSRYDRRILLLAIVCLALNWLGDSLDGTLARVRRQERPRYGFYVDHIVDVLGSVALMCGLGWSGLLHWATAMAMLIAFLVLSSESYLATYTLGTFHLSFAAFGPTEFRLLMIAGNVAVLWRPVVTVFGARHLLFDVGGVIGAAGMLLAFVWSAVRHGAELYRAETLR